MRLDERLYDTRLLKGDYIILLEEFNQIIDVTLNVFLKLITQMHHQVKIKCPMTYNHEIMYIEKDIL